MIYKYNIATSKTKEEIKRIDGVVIVDVSHEKWADFVVISIREIDWDIELMK